MIYNEQHSELAAPVESGDTNNEELKKKIQEDLRWYLVSYTIQVCPFRSVCVLIIMLLSNSTEPLNYV